MQGLKKFCGVGSEPPLMFENLRWLTIEEIVIFMIRIVMQPLSNNNSALLIKEEKAALLVAPFPHFYMK